MTSPPSLPAALVSLFLRKTKNLASITASLQEWAVAGEIGVADRFGHYSVCCSPLQATLTSSSVLTSGELWFGPAVRYDSFVLFKSLRIVPGFTAGFSLVTNSIGAEEGKVLFKPGNATFLGIWGLMLHSPWLACLSGNW